MIVLSAALVVVAAIALVVGLFTGGRVAPSLSIALSLVAAILTLIEVNRPSGLRAPGRGST